MLSRLILLAIQLVVAWFGAPTIVNALPPFGNLRIFVFAVVFAVLVWLVGLIGAQVLKDSGTPSSATLVTCIIVALIGAAIVVWLPTLVPDVGRLLPRVDDRVYPLIGAVIGYHIKR